MRGVIPHAMEQVTTQVTIQRQEQMLGATHQRQITEAIQLPVALMLGVILPVTNHSTIEEPKWME